VSLTSTINEKSSHDHLDLCKVYLQILEYLRETWLAWGANTDHDKLGYSVISTSLEDVEFPKMVVSV
jgi:hypothetical protein